MNRRHLLLGAASAGIVSALAAPSIAQTALKPVRMLLNTSVSGPQAWFFLAQDRGYFADEGFDVTFTAGSGAYTAAPRLMGDRFDIGYGDINSLVEVASANPNDAPVGVFAMFNASPSTIAVRADSDILTPHDLDGKSLVGHASDVALRTFGAFCQSTGVDQSKVQIGSSDGGFSRMLSSMLSGQGADGVFGYVSTISSALAQGERDRNHLLRHLAYADHVPDLYGSTIMATRKMLRDDPVAIAALVRAVNRGVRDTVADPAAGIDAVLRRRPNTNRNAQTLRLQRTLDIEMGHAEGAALGIGAVDPERLARSIALIAHTNGLSRTPDLESVFDDRFLPPLAQRVRGLAA